MRKLLMLIATMIMCDAYGENMTWFADAVIHADTSCTANGNITTPTAPQKEGGYRFVGWKELTVPTNWQQMIFFSFTSYTPEFGYTGSSTTWSATGNYGTLYGESKCAAEKGVSCLNKDETGEKCTTSDSLTSKTGTSAYCWCKITRVTFNKQTTNLTSLPWVYRGNPNVNTGCTNGNCASACGNSGWAIKNFKRAMAGLTGS